MKRLMFAPILLCSLLSSWAFAQTSASDLTGTWRVHISVMGNDSDRVCTITQKDAVLTGTCKNDQGQDQALDGKVDGKTVVWTVKGEYEGSPLTINYHGTLDGDKISGTIDVDPYNVTGDFKATKSK